MIIKKYENYIINYLVFIKFRKKYIKKMENENLDKNTFNNNKPKYQYEIKIINDSLSQKNKLKSKSKSPNSIISSINFTILNKSSNKKIKYKVGKIKRFYDHYDDFNNYRFYESKSSRTSKSEKPFLKNDDKDYLFQNYIFNNIDNERNMSQREDSNDIFNYTDRKRNNKSVNNNMGEYEDDENNEINAKKIFFKSTNTNVERKYKNFNQYSINQLKKHFKQQLQIEKSIEKSFCPQKRGISLSSLRQSNNNNCLYYETTYLTKNKINSFIKNMINNKKLNINKYLYIKKKLNKQKSKNVKDNNFQMVQNNFTKRKYNLEQNNIFQYNDKMHTPKKNSQQNEINGFLNNEGISLGLKTNINNNIKASERLERIKHFYLGKKISPLKIIKPTPDSKNKKENKIAINDIKYSLLSTSLDTKPIKEIFKKKTLEEKSSNLYILIPEIFKKDRNRSKDLRLIKSSDDIKSKKDNVKKGRDKFIFKRKVCNNRENEDSNNNNIYKNINNISVIKKNKDNDPKEINDDIYMKNVIDNIYNFNNYANNFNERNANNNLISIDEKIEYIKYLYYSYNDLDSFNHEKLGNYFLKLSEEEKIAVLTKLNNDDNKNKNLYKILINIINERSLKRTKSIKNISRNIHKKVDNNNANGEINKKRNNSSIILFKKKTYLK